MSPWTNRRSAKHCLVCVTDVETWERGKREKGRGDWGEKERYSSPSLPPFYLFPFALFFPLPLCCACHAGSHCFSTPRSTRVWLIVAGRGLRVQSRGRGSKVAVAGPMSRSRVQSRGRRSNVAAEENDLGFEVTAEWKRQIWKKSFLCTILYGSQFTGYGC